MTTLSTVRSGRVGVGVIGAGNISDTCLENLRGFPDLDVHMVGDLNVDRVRMQTVKHSVTAFGSASDVLARPAVEIIVNLTISAVHAEISTHHRRRQACGMKNRSQLTGSARKVCSEMRLALAFELASLPTPF